MDRVFQLDAASGGIHFATERHSFLWAMGELEAGRRVVRPSLRGDLFLDRNRVLRLYTGSTILTPAWVPTIDDVLADDWESAPPAEPGHNIQWAIEQARKRGVVVSREGWPPGTWAKLVGEAFYDYCHVARRTSSQSLILQVADICATDWKAANV